MAATFYDMATHKPIMSCDDMNEGFKDFQQKFSDYIVDPTSWYFRDNNNKYKRGDKIQYKEKKEKKEAKVYIDMTLFSPEDLSPVECVVIKTENGEERMVKTKDIIKKIK